MTSVPILEPIFDEHAFLIRNFLMPEECATFIRESEALGYEDAPITMGDSAIIIKDYRDNLRAMRDDTETAERLFDRLQPFVPADISRMKPVGLNERLRFYRYDRGHYFAPHHDGSFRRNLYEFSLYTVLLYLNEGFAGGSTDFLNEDNSVLHRVVPETGLALLFRHEILHTGAEVIDGTKYVLRSDVMYRIPSALGVRRYALGVRR